MSKGMTIWSYKAESGRAIHDGNTHFSGIGTTREEENIANFFAAVINYGHAITVRSRVVFRVDAVVYKIDTSHKDNEREYRCFTYFANELWSSPVSLYWVNNEPILCMPYYEPTEESPKAGELKAIEDDWWKWVDTQPGNCYVFCDFHRGNYRIVDGQIKIIDLIGGGWYDED